MKIHFGNLKVAVTNQPTNAMDVLEVHKHQISKREFFHIVKTAFDPPVVNFILDIVENQLHRLSHSCENVFQKLLSLSNPPRKLEEEKIF